MLFSTLLSGLGLMGLATAFPQRLATRQQASGQNVVYWGQNGGGTIENNDLAAYCTATSGIDVLVLAFLYQFGGAGGNVANGIIGQSCYISPEGQPQNCEALTAAIATCKSRGVKIILSLGGASGAYSLSSQSQAEAIGQYLWDAYGGSSSSVTRPLGANVMDGFDFDIETNGGSSQYYQYMIAKLRSLYATDPSRTYYITGAPQCPIPEPNMSVIIENSIFDWLMVQFYNNNDYTVPCALGINGDAAFNYNNWTSYLQSTPSKNAKLFIGVPASELGANGTPNGAKYYATPDQLATIVAEYKTKPNFGGVMMWAAGFSDSNVSNGCTYAQQVKSILLTGNPCAGAPISTQLPTPTSTPAPTSPGATPTKTTGSTAPTGGSGTGTVPQWGQCGGMGYTGPTQCIPPYTCVTSGAWWADCR